MSLSSHKEVITPFAPYHMYTPDQFYILQRLRYITKFRKEKLIIIIEICIMAEEERGR